MHGTCVVGVGVAAQIPICYHTDDLLQITCKVKLSFPRTSSFICVQNSINLLLYNAILQKLFVALKNHPHYIVLKVELYQWTFTRRRNFHMINYHLKLLSFQDVLKHIHNLSYEFNNYIKFVNKVLWKLARNW